MNFISAAANAERLRLLNHADLMADVSAIIARMNENDMKDDDLTDKDGAPQRTLYQLIGGDEKLRALVDRFYDLMDLEPEFAALRAMHPPSLEGSRDKLYHFLSGWSGGPDLYTPIHGNPFLRARHLPFSIGTPERDQWLTCMLLPMQELGYTEDEQDLLLNAFFRTADWMRNRQG